MITEDGAEPLASKTLEILDRQTSRRHHADDADPLLPRAAIVPATWVPSSSVFQSPMPEPVRSTPETLVCWRSRG